MRISEQQLKRIIKKETQVVLLEQALDVAGIIDQVCTNQKVIRWVVDNPNISKTLAWIGTKFGSDDAEQALTMLKKINPVLKQVLGTDIVGLTKDKKLKANALSIMKTVCKMRGVKPGEEVVAVPSAPKEPAAIATKTVEPKPEWQKKISQYYQGQADASKKERAEAARWKADGDPFWDLPTIKQLIKNPGMAKFTGRGDARDNELLRRLRLARRNRKNAGDAAAQAEIERQIARERGRP